MLQYVLYESLPHILPYTSPHTALFAGAKGAIKMANCHQNTGACWMSNQHCEAFEFRTLWNPPKQPSRLNVPAKHSEQTENMLLMIEAQLIEERTSAADLRPSGVYESAMNV